MSFGVILWLMLALPIIISGIFYGLYSTFKETEKDDKKSLRSKMR